MELSTFIQDLIREGKVIINEKIQPFSLEDLTQSAKHLQVIYEQDKLQMPFKAPSYSHEDALWGAKIIYRASQLIMLRETSNEEVEKLLALYTNPINAEVIYSTDLLLRHLPDLFQLGKGLSPDDVLVKCLRKIAHQFPFSSVGVELEEELNHKFIFEHPSLNQTYLDRIIISRDLERAKKADLLEKIKAVLGEHQETFWPQLTHITN